MMQKIQRFGGAMFTPVLLFAFAGIMAGISTLCMNEQILGTLANADGMWYQLWNIINQGSWTVFRNMPLVFAVGLPVGLAKKQNARACLEALVIYLTFNYFVNTILTQWGPFFGVDFTQEAVSGSGLALVAGIKTLDMGMMGAILVAAIVVWIHNRYFDTRLPEFLGIFKGSTFVYIIGFFVMIPVAFAAALIWPKVQHAIGALQVFLASSGASGVGIYSFLNRILIPTGLHHFVYSPFLYDNVAVQGGIVAYWTQHMAEFAASGLPLKELFPQGGFALYGMEKIFGSIGIALAFYKTAKPERKKNVAGLLIPITLTAVVAGVTEPLEFTFLFICPPLFALHSVLAGIMDMVTYMVGVVGNFAGGLIEFIAINWIPMGGAYYMTYVKQIIVGIVFIGIYYIVFKTVILKFDIKTPGREDGEEETKFYSKADYKEKTGSGKGNSFTQRAQDFLDELGGAGNIEDVTNCATRLRVSVKDVSLVQDPASFKASGAHGLVVKGNAIQVIVGMDVANVRDEFEALLAGGESSAAKQKKILHLGTPAEGTVLPLEEMKDEAFASGSLGLGVAVVPSGNTVHAPADVEVTMLFDTKHAVGMVTEDGVEILIHIGIDTVQLDGKGFTAHVSNGDKVKKGEKLITFDKELLEKEGYDTTIAVLVTNADQYEKVAVLLGEAKAGEQCIEIK